MREATEGFLTLIVYGYLFGAPTALLFGLLLRRIMLALKCKTPMHWAVAGAILAPLVVVALGIGEPSRSAGAAAGLRDDLVSAGRRGCRSARGMVASNSGGRSRRLLPGPNSARVRAAPKQRRASAFNDARHVRRHQLVANAAPADALGQQRRNKIPRK